MAFSIDLVETARVATRRVLGEFRIGEFRGPPSPGASARMGALAVRGVLGAVVALSLLASLPLTSACSSGPKSGDSLYLSSGPVNFRGESRADDLPTLDVTLGQNWFQPTFIYGSSGQRLELVLRNDTDRSHSFVTGIGLAVPATPRRTPVQIPPHSSVSVHVTFGDSGNRLFYCDYNWREGMVGELVRFSPTAEEEQPP
ncbi:MAG: hypothetical protein WEC33_03215 [Dehalococcoidia bacterium]